nr:hypothetical protein HK105_000583 [Polyrhizophydium stewartii]
MAAGKQQQQQQALALAGLRVIEFGGLAPGPFAGMVLADFGADVVRINRSDETSTYDVLARGKRSIQLNLKQPAGVDLVLRLLDKADVLIDPYRPGVLERLGLGPDVVLRRNPRLIYARLTGFGQTGPLASMAGHDINYIAITGVLSLLGRKDSAPQFPANIVGDFAGGGMLCVVGILIALFERQKSGKGQVVDAAMVPIDHCSLTQFHGAQVDGATYLSSFIFRMRQKGMWNAPRGENLLDSGAPFYDVYETSDGKFMAVGALEPQFYAELIKGLGLDARKIPKQGDMSRWDELRRIFADTFKSKTRDEWTAVFMGKDACVTPVIDPDEAPLFDANRARSVMVLSADRAAEPDAKDDPLAFEPAAAPRLSRTPARPSRDGVALPEPRIGQHTTEVLAEAGLSEDEIKQALGAGIAGPALRRKAKSKAAAKL